MRSFTRAVSVLLLLCAVTAAADEYSETVQVVSLSRLNVLVVRFRNLTDLFPPGEGVCFFRRRRRVACGHVTSSDQNGIEAQLTHGSNRFRIDETLTLEPSPEFAVSDLRGFEQFNLETGGAFIGPSGFYLYPYLHFQISIMKHIAIGAQPFFTTQQSGNLSAYGGFLTSQYYFGKRPWRGIYFEIGLGIMSESGTSSPDSQGNTYSGSATSLVMKGLFGYHLLIADTFHIGFSGGLQFLSKNSTTVGNNTILVFGFPTISPEMELEFGYLF